MNEKQKLFHTFGNLFFEINFIILCNKIFVIKNGVYIRMIIYLKLFVKMRP